MSAIFGFEKSIQERTAREDKSTYNGAYEYLVGEYGSGSEERVPVYSDHPRVVEGSDHESDVREGYGSISETEFDILLFEPSVGHDDKRDQNRPDPNANHAVVDPEIPGNRESCHRSDRAKVAYERNECVGSAWNDE